MKIFSNWRNYKNILFNFSTNAIQQRSYYEKYIVANVLIKTYFYPDEKIFLIASPHRWAVAALFRTRGWRRWCRDAGSRGGAAIGPAWRLWAVIGGAESRDRQVVTRPLRRPAPGTCRCRDKGRWCHGHKETVADVSLHVCLNVDGHMNKSKNVFTAFVYISFEEYMFYSKSTQNLKCIYFAIQFDFFMKPESLQTAHNWNTKHFNF